MKFWYCLETSKNPWSTRNPFKPMSNENANGVKRKEKEAQI